MTLQSRSPPPLTAGTGLTPTLCDGLANLQTNSNDPQQQQHQQSQKIQQTTAQLKINIEENLSTIDHLEAWRRIDQQRLPQTTEWAHQHPQFIDWLADEKTAILWCPGITGIGKTVLISHLIAVLQQKCSVTNILSWHFCRARRSATLLARTILGSIARQLTSFAISRIREEAELVRLCHITQALNAEEMAGFILPFLEADRIYYVVLDGLDEANHIDILTVAKGMAQICDRCPANLKIIYTGRPELRASLFGQVQFKYSLDISGSAVMNDIDRFAKFRLDRCHEDESREFSNGTSSTEILDMVKGTSGKTFLWTQLFIDEICAHATDDDILVVTQYTPLSVHELIECRLKRVRNHHAAERAIKLLQLCGVAKRPLKVDEYRELLAISNEQEVLDQTSLLSDMTSVIDACNKLVSVDSEDDTVEYIHRGIWQYLFRGDRSDSNEFDESALDLHLGTLCLTYLNFGDFKKQSMGPKLVYSLGLQPTDDTVTPVSHPANHVNLDTQQTDGQGSTLWATQGSEHEQQAREVPEALESISSRAMPEQTEYAFLQYARTYWIDHLTRLDCEHDARLSNMFHHCVFANDQLSYKPWAVDYTRKSRRPPIGDQINEMARWSIKYKNFGLLSYVVMNFAGAIAEEVKLEVLTGKEFRNCDRAVSLIVLNTSCEPDTLCRGLLRAIKTERYNCVDVFLNAGSDVDGEVGSGSRALVYAARQGGMSLVNKLLSAGADVNARPARDSGRTALQAAAMAGHTEVVDKLLAAGAELNAPSGKVFGLTALQAAAAGGHVDLVDKFLAAHSDVNAPPCEYNGRTALQAAAEGGHAEIVDKLLAAGADLNAGPGVEYGLTALQAAAAGGHIGVVDKLLAAQAEVNGPTSEYGGRTALRAAIEGGYSAIIERLQTAGADDNTDAAVEVDGNVPLLRSHL